MVRAVINDDEADEVIHTELYVHLSNITVILNVNKMPVYAPYSLTQITKVMCNFEYKC